MTATVTQTFAASTTAAITSLNSLAAATMSSSSNTVAQSVSISNSGGARDALIQIGFSTTTTGTLTNGKAVYVFAYGTENTVLGSPATGSDTTLSIPNPYGLKMVGFVPVSALSTAYVSQPLSIAAAFNGILPRSWGVIVVNDTGLSLSTAGSTFSYSLVTDTIT